LSKHFGYALFDERGEPFYIGIGSRNSRPTDHLRNAKKGLRGRRYSKIRRMLRNGFDIPIVVFREGMTLAEAKEMEIALVAVIKRWPDGPLTNINAGGNSPHDVHYNLGKHRPETTKAKISLALTGRVLGPRSPEVVKRVRRSLIGRKCGSLSDQRRAEIAEATRISWLDPDVRASRLNNGMKGRTHRLDTIEKMKDSALARVTDELRERGRQLGLSRRGMPSPRGMAGKKHTAETKARISTASSNVTPERAEARRLQMAELGRTPREVTLETRARLSESHKGISPSAETREKLRAASTAAWAKRKNKAG